MRARLSTYTPRMSGCCRGKSCSVSDVRSACVHIFEDVPDIALPENETASSSLRVRAHLYAQCLAARASSSSIVGQASARWLYFCGGHTSIMVPLTRFALSDLPVLLGGDLDVRSVWVPLFEDVPEPSPFLPSLISIRDWTDM